MIRVQAAQRSPEWYQARLGRLTGSRAADAFATLKSGGEAASRRNYRLQIVLERLTGKSQERDFQSQAMLDGIEREADARSAYEVFSGRMIDEVGFCQHDTLMVGCSPDGLVDDGMIEIKAPFAATHLEYLRGTVPGEYQKQIALGLWITGAFWCDFVSYHPDFPAGLKLKVTRVHATAADVAATELLARQFLGECDRDCAELQSQLTETVF